MIIPFKHLRAGKDKVSAKQYNKLVDLVEMMANSLLADGIMAGGQILKRRVTGSSSGTDFPIKIFEVQSNGTGDGVYNCHEEMLDNSEWDSTDGDPHTGEKNTTDYYVLNLLETHCHATYARNLIAGDLIASWQWVDDASTTRWVGIPVGIQGNVRIAKAQENAPADANLSVKIIDQDGSVTGAAFDVACNIAQGGAALNAAIPRIATNDLVTVTNIAGTWYCTTLFQPSEDCVCS